MGMSKHARIKYVTEIFAMTPQPWVERAACSDADPEIFYNEGLGASLHKQSAKRICAGCPVAAQCLRYAYEVDDQHAIMGGLTPDERARLRKGRRVA